MYFLFSLLPFVGRMCVCVYVCSVHRARSLLIAQFINIFPCHISLLFSIWNYAWYEKYGNKHGTQKNAPPTIFCVPPPASFPLGNISHRRCCCCFWLGEIGVRFHFISIRCLLLFFSTTLTNFFFFFFIHLKMKRMRKRPNEIHRPRIMSTSKFLIHFEIWANVKHVQLQTTWNCCFFVGGGVYVWYLDA